MKKTIYICVFWTFQKDPAFMLSNMEEIGEDTFSKPSENKEKIDTNLNNKENTLINNSFPKKIN